jgi:hypothetical protein
VTESPEMFVSIEVGRMKSCLDNLRPTDNKNFRAASAYNYLLAMTLRAPYAPAPVERVRERV